MLADMSFGHRYAVRRGVRTRRARANTGPADRHSRCTGEPPIGHPPRRRVMSPSHPARPVSFPFLFIAFPLLLDASCTLDKLPEGKTDAGTTGAGLSLIHI